MWVARLEWAGRLLIRGLISGEQPQLVKEPGESQDAEPAATALQELTAVQIACPKVRLTG
jgi:hypothetical protein